MKHGNLDKEKKHDLSGIKGIANGGADDKVIVRHFNTVAYANGTRVEDPTTSRIQVYRKDEFENLNRQPVKDGVQQKSQFQEAGLNVDVLHYPGKMKEPVNDGAGDTGLTVAGLNVVDATAKINEATSAEEVDKLVGDDQRKGVLKAAEEKKATFA